MSDCIFCKIASGEMKADVVLDRDGIVAFRDIGPKAPTHVLVIPKEHIRDVTEMTAEHASLLSKMLAAANEIAASDGVGESGYRLVFNVGPDAGQTVFHLHLHVLGGRPMKWPPG